MNKINTKLLIEKMNAAGVNRKDISEKIGCSYHTVCEKIKGNSEFNVREMKQIWSMLKLDNADFSAIFFPDNGSADDEPKEQYANTAFINQNGKPVKIGICVSCGAQFLNGNPSGSKYCATCKQKMKLQKAAERQRRYRARKRAEKAAASGK